MTFTLPETLWLAEQGFEDLLLAYPTADAGALEELALRSAANPERAPIVMVDCAEHLDLIESVLGAAAAPVRVCIDLDASWWALGGRIKVGAEALAGPHASSRRWRWPARSSERPQIELAALMAYEGQIAGVGDRPPGRRLRGAAIRFMQRRSAAELAERRGGDRRRDRASSPSCEIVNGGGTGSLELTAAEEAVTEVTAGSGFYAPALFDHYSRFTPHPGRRLRAADRAQAGARGGDRARRRLPRLGRRRRRRACPPPGCPPGLQLDAEEGAGEVQTPLLGAAAGELRDRRPRLPAPRQGRRALRALRLPPPGRGRRDRRRGPHLPRRGPGLPLDGRWAGKG